MSSNSLQTRTYVFGGERVLGGEVGVGEEGRVEEFCS